MNPFYDKTSEGIVIKAPGILVILGSFYLLGFWAGTAFGDASFHVYARPGIHVNGKCISTALLSHDKKTLTATVDILSCTTNNGARDKHMQEDLGSKVHPVALLKATLGDNSFSGYLTIRGVSKPITGKREGKKLSFSTKLSEFGVPQRSVMGIAKVQDDVEIVGEF